MKYNTTFIYNIRPPYIFELAKDTPLPSVPTELWSIFKPQIIFLIAFQRKMFLRYWECTIFPKLLKFHVSLSSCFLLILHIVCKAHIPRNTMEPEHAGKYVSFLNIVAKSLLFTVVGYVCLPRGSSVRSLEYPVFCFCKQWTLLTFCCIFSLSALNKCPLAHPLRPGPPFTNMV